MSGDFKLIHTVDPSMRELIVAAENVACSRASVFITGESGTGKELLARYIHSKSPRSGRAFVALNCAAMPEGLLESELFGYEKGSFTGANVRKIGKFELAHKGTFLLDEVTEMSLPLQAKLLRVLQEGEVERLGAERPQKVDVRVVATSNRNLAQAIEEGVFREDLYYRLNVIPLEIPPLRQRRQDIPLLAELFLEMSCSENGITKKHLSSCATEKLLAWNWPGNVRELQNVIERSALMASSGTLNAQDILIRNFQSRVTNQDILTPGMTVLEAERLLILKTLEHTGQNRTHAAHLLGISIRTLRNKLNEYKEPLKEVTL